MNRTEPQPDSNTSRKLDELAQAKIRTYLHLILVSLTFWAYRIDGSIQFSSVVFVSLASIASAVVLYTWAVLLERYEKIGQTRTAQRVCGLVSDNTFITLVLLIGGEATAGIWALHIWISIGYGVRYGVGYLRANVVVSLASFLLVYSLTPFWNARPAFSFGMSIALLIVPLYVGWLIKQLHTAVAEREAAYAAKSEFTARMSHELRTPLHAIISTADILKTHVGGGKSTELLNLISVSSSTLLDLINKVLDLSRFESGNFSVTESPINLYLIVSDCAKIIYSEAEKKKIALNLRFDPEIEPLVFGAPDQLKEVLVNLLGNAVKFTNQGEVSISANLDSETASHVCVRFEVNDTGIGIPKDKLNTILEPYVRIDGGDSGQGGAGLGMSFARELVRAMGGTITIESELGAGTTFNVFLTFRKQLDSVVSAQYEDLELVLVAEGAKFLPLVEALEELGAGIERAPNVADAARLIQARNIEERISGVLLCIDDYASNIPVAVATLRKSCDARIFPIIAVGKIEYRAVSLASGCISFATYPLSTTMQHRILHEFSAVSSLGAEHLASIPDAKRRTRPLKILVADDNATNRNILEMILDEAGHNVVIVDDGELAFFELSDKHYDVAILDMHMPKRDGLEVIRLYEYSNFERSRRTKMILFTADTTQSTKRLAYNSGVDLFLTKPIRPAHILHAITEVVSSTQHIMDQTNVTATEKPLSQDPTIVALNEPPPRLMSEPKLLNEGAIADILGFMSKDEQTEFFGDFLEDVQQYVESYSQAATIDEIEKAQNDMHALAGASLTVGAMQLAEVAKEIEMMAAGDALRFQSERAEMLKNLTEVTLDEISKRYLN